MTRSRGCLCLHAGMLPVYALAVSFVFLAIGPHSDAQQPDAQTPDPQPPSIPLTFENPLPHDQISFLKDFEGHPTKELMKDKRFKGVLKNEIPRTEYHYGRDMPLNDALWDALDGSKEPVVVRGGRYVTASGAQGPYLRGRGFVWIDLEQGVFLGGFYFQPTNGEPTPTLTIFSRQMDTDDLALSQLPPEFANDLFRWSSTAHVPVISARYFIPVDGRKYVLVHDEPYCTVPATDACKRLEEQAADADVNAAYFMKETHNAANATAWMLGPDQVAWIGLRDSTCGLSVGCRIVFTRRRTRVLMGPPRPRASR